MAFQHHRTRRCSAALSRIAALVLLGLIARAGGAADAAGSTHYSDALQQLMRRMDALVYDRNETELALDRERLERAHELAAAAAELAAETSAAPPASLDDAGRREFLAHAQALAAEAAVLDALAGARRYAELAPQMERVGHQCAACHVRFRVRVP